MNYDVENRMEYEIEMNSKRHWQSVPFALIIASGILFTAVAPHKSQRVVHRFSNTKRDLSASGDPIFRLI